MTLKPQSCGIRFTLTMSGGCGPTTPWSHSSRVAFQGRESRALRESSRTTKLLTSALPHSFPTEPGQLIQILWCRSRLDGQSFSLTITDCLLLCVQIVSHLVNSIRFSGLLSPLQKQTLDDRSTHEESAGSKSKAGKGLCLS